MRAEAGTGGRIGVFTSRSSAPLDAAHVRRDFRAAIRSAPGIGADAWTPHELRHTSASLLSDSGTPIEEICRLVEHTSTPVTELVHRKHAASCDSVRGHRRGSALRCPGSQLAWQETLDVKKPGPSGEEPGFDRAGSWWAILGLNQWPLPCQGSALPLS